MNTQTPHSNPNYSSYQSPPRPAIHSDRLNRRRVIAYRLLPGFRIGDVTGDFCRCPGLHRHTTPNKPGDCRVFLQGAPTVSCLHQHCGDDVYRVNCRLRSEIGRAEAGYGSGQPWGIAGKHQHASESHKTAISRLDETMAHKMRQRLPEILAKYTWPEVEIQIGQVSVQPSFGDAHCFLRMLYRPDDVIWIGKCTDSGSPANAFNFRTVSSWLTEHNFPGPLICPSIFRPGVYGRTKVNVLSRPYLVLEGDSVDQICAEKQQRMAAKKARGETLSPDDYPNDQDKMRNRIACLAVINWLRTEAGLQLRAIVDTTGKSLHGWFDFPNEAVVKQLEVLLPPLGFDKSTLGAAQPVRLPGVLRPETNRAQRCIYLNPKMN